MILELNFLSNTPYSRYLGSHTYNVPQCPFVANLWAPYRLNKDTLTISDFRLSLVGLGELFRPDHLSRYSRIFHIRAES